MPSTRVLLSAPLIAGAVFSLTAAAKAQDFAPPAATAALVDPAGESRGEAAFWPANGGVLMRISVAGYSTGWHGMHFHAIGACDPEGGFSSAGPHIMPSGKPHGYFHPEGPHEGNLPNLWIAEDGRGQVELYTTLVTLDDGPAGLLDADGATLIIHENPDDHLTQPIGGAGGRIGCGVIAAVEHS